MNSNALPQQNPSRRYLSLWLPYLRFERSPSARPAEPIPWVLVEKQKGALRLVACDPVAREAGLRVGQTLAEARAVVRAVHVHEIDRIADSRVLLKWAQACERFTPLFALDGDDGLLLDVTGCAHLYGGEAALQQRIARLFAARGFTLRQAMAGTPHCAHVLARHSKVVHVEPGHDAQAVARLPVQALEAGQKVHVALIRAGLKTLGDLAVRPTQMLTARFGADVSSKLNRILGREDTRLTPLRTAPELVVGRLFAEPIQHMDQINAALAGLLDDMEQQLEAQAKGGRVFEVSFFRTDGMVRRLDLTTATPMRDPASLAKLFALRLDTLSEPLEMGFGFDALRLAVLRAEALAQQQTQFDAKHETGQSESDLVNRLIIRFGMERVLGFVAQDSHDPLRAAVTAPVAAARFGEAAFWKPNETPLPRPLQLFAPPQPIDVMAEVPDGPPRQFRWRKLLHQVRAAEGPERIEAEWWREKRPVRDYYRVEDKDGTRFWVFREGLYPQNPRWFMHGLFP